MLLSGCSNKIVSSIHYQYPPQAYLTECERSTFQGQTYGDMIDFAIKITAERDLCAIQIENIRKWVEQKKGEMKD